MSAVEKAALQHKYNVINVQYLGWMEMLSFNL